MHEPPLETDADGVRARPRRTGHNWLDLTLAVCAILISVVSLFVAVEHGRTERELVTASTWPFLIFDTRETGKGDSDQRRLALIVKNAGVGPAHLESARLTLDGKPVRSAGELLSLCCGLPAGSTVVDRRHAGVSAESSMPGVLPAREEIDLLAVTDPPGDQRLRLALDAASRRMSFAVCYCSVLNECWTTGMKDSDTPRSVESCTPGADDYRD